jgi:hypothetical protein
MIVNKNLQVEAEQKNQQKSKKRYMLSYTLFEGKNKSPRWIRSPFNNQEEVKEHISYIVTQELCGKDSFSNLEIISEDDLDKKIEDTLSLREYKFGKTYQNIADRSFDEKLKTFVFCNQCASACCCGCYNKIESDACPTCRHESFTKMMIEI